MTAPAILVVDDRPENLVAMRAALEPLGYRLVTAESGEDALRKLLTDEFALVVLDVQMPGIDGFETARAIKDRPRTKDLPILFLTAISREEEHRLAGYASGGVDYLFKPIAPDLLRAKVSVFVQLHQKQVELERKTHALEQSNRDLEQFSYVASHDLQEPLRVVTGYLELLEDVLPADDAGEARSWLERCRATTARMSDLVSDLLAYARAGSTTVPAEDVDLANAASVALEHTRMLVAESSADVSVDSQLPKVRAAPREVVQVFQNVIANSIKYTPAGEPPSVTVSAVRDGGMVNVCVTDRGRGIPTDAAERVFGMFERVDEAAPYPGTGLGLAICRRIVENRGGRIWLEPSPAGRGTAVHFTLPAADGG